MINAYCGLALFFIDYTVSSVYSGEIDWRTYAIGILAGGAAWTRKTAVTAIRSWLGFEDPPATDEAAAAGASAPEGS
ncbi:MAG: hypothetical protein EPN91_02070 [Salinibacterium sp.]|nr:MAG: hypothetical protein EPN91_02070 [Salinibacterium sp.]